MKKTIADNEWYQVKVDTLKSRLYITLKGFWRSPAQVPNYLKDIQKATNQLAGSFTCLANFSMLMPFGKEMQPIFTDSIRLLLAGGMGKNAQLLPLNLETSENLASYFKQADFDLTAFGDEEIAELYLDS